MAGGVGLLLIPWSAADRVRGADPRLLEPIDEVTVADG
jgi:hypothetical protein